MKSSSSSATSSPKSPQTKDERSPTPSESVERACKIAELQRQLQMLENASKSKKASLSQNLDVNKDESSTKSQKFFTPSQSQVQTKLSEKDEEKDNTRPPPQDVIDISDEEESSKANQCSPRTTFSAASNAAATREEAKGKGAAAKTVKGVEESNGNDARRTSAPTNVTGETLNVAKTQVTPKSPGKHSDDSKAGCTVMTIGWATYSKLAGHLRMSFEL
jgi:hypothetical protein